MPDADRVAKLRRQLQKKAIPFHNVFNTPEGQMVLDQLKSEFAPSELVHQTQHGTVVRAAQRDVIEYIENMIRLREEEFT